MGRETGSDFSAFCSSLFIQLHVDERFANIKVAFNYYYLASVWLFLLGMLLFLSYFADFG